MTEPYLYMIASALDAARQSPCRSKRGVVLYDMANGAFRGSGHNGPPGRCPGRDVCAGSCGQRSVHAEVRALWAAEVYRSMGHPPGPYDLIHVELAEDGGVVACAGPSCLPCAAQILDVGFVGGVWLYEQDIQKDDEESNLLADGTHTHIPGWRSYTAAEFYRASMVRR